MGVKKAMAALAATSVLLGVAPPTSPASAQTSAPGSATLTVSPPLFETAGSPGAELKQRVALTNESDNPRVITVEKQNFTARGEEGQAELCIEDCPFPLAPWVTVTPSTVTIAPKVRQEFDVTINVPGNAEPGGHYGALVFSPAVSDDPNANVRVVSQVSALMLVRVPGDVIETAKIESFESDKNRYSKGPVNFDIRVKADGNVHVKPTGTIEVSNIFGSKIATIPVAGQNVLPSTVRNLKTKWDHSQLFGPYKAKLTLTYGGTEQKLESSTRFWGAPIITIAIIAGILLLLFFFLWLPRKRLKKAFKALASSE